MILDDNVEVLREFSAASLIAIQIRKPRVAAIFGEEQRSWSLSAPWLVDRLVTFVRHHSNPVASNLLRSGCFERRGALFARPVPESACAKSAFVPVKRKRRLGVFVFLVGQSCQKSNLHR